MKIGSKVIIHDHAFQNEPDGVMTGTITKIYHDHFEVEYWVYKLSEDNQPLSSSGFYTRHTFHKNQLEERT